MTLVAYTDGSGSRAHLHSGAGVVVYDGEDIILEASRHLGLGTCNHAELSAMRVALYITSFPPLLGRELLIKSDSEYAIAMAVGRYAVDPERPNAKLIGYVRAALIGRVVRFEHVLGHTGIPGNERADELASLGRKRGMAPLQTPTTTGTP